MTVPSSANLPDSFSEPTLLIHTDPKGWERAVERSDRDGGGVVLHSRRGITAAEHIQATKPAYRRPVLVDASAYSGKNRKLASAPFDENWTSKQRRLKLAAVLPDAGYVDEDDELGLMSILARVRDEGDGMVAPLALNRAWLDPKRGLDTLRHHICEFGVPLALFLEHTNDPLQVRYALRGLISIIDTGVPVMLLRCDASALGALCYGAVAAAVGTRTGLRHLYPPSAGGGGGSPSVAVLIRGILSYISVDKLDLAYQRDPENQLWSCDCLVCGGQDLSWIGSSPDREMAAYLHSAEVLYQLRDDLFENALTVQDRRRSWTARCDAAIFHHQELGESIRWEPPKGLGNWASLAPPEFTN